MRVTLHGVRPREGPRRNMTDLPPPLRLYIRFWLIILGVAPQAKLRERPPASDFFGRGVNENEK